MMLGVSQGTVKCADGELRLAARIEPAQLERGPQVGAEERQPGLVDAHGRALRGPCDREQLGRVVVVGVGRAAPELRLLRLVVQRHAVASLLLGRRQEGHDVAHENGHRARRQVVPHAGNRHELRAGNAPRGVAPAGDRHQRIGVAVQHQRRAADARQQVRPLGVGADRQHLPHHAGRPVGAAQPAGDAFGQHLLVVRIGRARDQHAPAPCCARAARLRCGRAGAASALPPRRAAGRAGRARRSNS